MRKLALATLSFALVLSLCPTASMAAYAESADLLPSTGQAEVPSDGIGNIDTTEDEIEPSVGIGISVPDSIASQDSAANEIAWKQSLAAIAEAEDTSTRMTAQNIPYIDANGVRQTRPEATVVTSDENEWTSGWYIATNTVDATERFVVKGDVHLILAAGCALNATKGITVSKGNSLTIYSQTLDASSIGKLWARSADNYSAGIGGSDAVDAGRITINGGNIYAEGASLAAGIGGGSNRPNGYESITINNGFVEARGGSDAAGIGGGCFSAYGGSIEINGGQINANGGTRAAAIGGGSGGMGGSITINGGEIFASGGDYGAGIGGGYHGNGGIIKLNGGAVQATGGIQGAGIGGGVSGDGGTIVIAGGLISARGNTSSCGIGGGTYAAGGNITINGGNVSARSVSVDCAAIGGAKEASGGNIALNGGIIDAQGGTGIGNGEGGAGCTLSTTDSGSAFITANMINGSEASLISCIYFIGANGYVRGDQTLTKDLHLSQGQYLYTSASDVLRVPAGITLTNDGVLFDRGELENNGTIVNNGGTRVLSSAKLTNKGTFTNNGALEVLGTLESTGTINGAGTFSGNKAAQAAPAAPQKQSVTESSVTLVPITTSGSGDLQYGYSSDGTVPVSWQTSNTFTGLSADTTYTFFARYDGNTYFETATSAGTSIATAAIRSGHVENVTDASLNYLGADFVLPGDAVADAILPAYARKQLSLGKDVDIWMESNRITDGSISSAVESELGDFLPGTYFGLASHYQVDGEAPQEASAETNDDTMVLVRLRLTDATINSDPSITREYKVICVYDGATSILASRYYPDSQTIEFRTNRFASFCLACKDTRDGKTVYPVMVRDSYARDSGQGQYAAGDTVVVNAGARDGYMVEFWNGAPSDKIHFTIIDSSHASFVMPEGAVMVSPQWVRIGDISNVTDVEANALHAKLVNSGVDLAERVLPADAFAQLPALKNVDIWLKSIEGISDADAALVAENLGDWTLASEVDLTLFYKMDGAETQIHETNKPVTVQLTLPDSAINTDASKTRSYEVIRVHDGKASVIPSSFDADAKTLTFETDRFSAYAVAYKDAVDEGIGDTTEGDGKAPAQDNADDVPNSLLAMTGDASMPTALVLAALAALSILLVARRLRAQP